MGFLFSISGTFLDLGQEYLPKETHLHENMSNNFFESYRNVLSLVSRVVDDTVLQVHFLIFLYFSLYLRIIYTIRQREIKKKDVVFQIFSSFSATLPASSHTLGLMLFNFTLKPFRIHK